jgi:predicted PurR-regulated permease PerM
MIELNKSSRGINILVCAASFVIIIAGINLAQSVIELCIASVFLALIGTPPVLWLERKRIPSFVSVAIVISVMVIILLMIVTLVGTSLKSFTDALPYYQIRVQEQITEIKTLLTKVGITITDESFSNYFNPETIMNLTAGLLSGVSSVFSSIVLVLLTVAFILLEVSSFPVKLRAVLGNPEAVFPRFSKFVIDIRHYLVITTLINLVAGILIWLWLSILGIRFPILWGFLVFLLHYIPNIGSVIAAIPAVILALIQQGIGSALFVAGGYLLVGFVLGNVIQPKLMGRRLGLSTLVVFISLIFWGSLLGLIGAVLCIPLTMMVKFAFESNAGTKWIAVLLGPEKPVDSRHTMSKGNKKTYGKTKD